MLAFSNTHIVVFAIGVVGIVIVFLLIFYVIIKCGGIIGSLTLSKHCSACGKIVSNSSRAGQRCPHCGAYWSTELRRY